MQASISALALNPSLFMFDIPYRSLRGSDNGVHIVRGMFRNVHGTSALYTIRCCISPWMACAITVLCILVGCSPSDVEYNPSARAIIFCTILSCSWSGWELDDFAGALGELFGGILSESYSCQNSLQSLVSCLSLKKGKSKHTL